MQRLKFWTHFRTPDHDFGRSAGEVEGTFWCKRRNRHSSEGESWGNINEKRVGELFSRYEGDAQLKIGYKVPGFKKSIFNTVFNLFQQVLERVPEKYSLEAAKSSIVSVPTTQSLDTSLPGWTPTMLDVMKCTPDFGPYSMLKYMYWRINQRWTTLWWLYIFRSFREKQ